MSKDKYTMGWTDPAVVFGAAPIKAEGGAVGSAGDSLTYNMAHRYTKALTPYGEALESFKKLEYILQRTVPNYDELVTQYNALKDIEESNYENNHNRL